MAVFLFLAMAQFGAQAAPLMHGQSYEHSFVANGAQDLSFSNGAQITNKCVCSLLQMSQYIPQYLPKLLYFKICTRCTR